MSQSQSFNVTKFGPLASAPEVTDSPLNPANYGAVVLKASGAASSGTALVAQIPLPVGASISEFIFAVTGASLKSAGPAPSLEISVSTATTAPATGNVCTALTMTNYTVNKAETVQATAFTNFTNAQNIARGSYLYVTPSSTYVLDANAVYTVYYRYTLPIA